MSEEVRQSTVALGIGLSLLACTLNAGGINVQRFSKRPGHESSLVNVLGIGLTALAGVVDMTSFSFAPQTILAPLAAMTLVMNLLIAPVLNHEHLSLRDIVATCIIFSGVVGCVVAGLGTPEGAGFNAETLVSFVVRDMALKFFGGALVLLCILICLMVRVEGRIAKEQQAAAGCNSNKKATLPPPALGFAGACYPLIAGILCTLTVIGAKFNGEVVKVGGPAAVGYPVFVASWAAIIGGAVSNVFFMNRGLGKGNSTLFAVPVFSGSVVVFNTISGAIFWDEISKFTPSQMQSIAISIAAVIAGIGVLLSKDPKPKLTKFVAMTNLMSKNKNHDQ